MAQWCVNHHHLSCFRSSHRRCFVRWLICTIRNIRTILKKKGTKKCFLLDSTFYLSSWYHMLIYRGLYVSHKTSLFYKREELRKYFSMKAQAICLFSVIGHANCLCSMLTQAICLFSVIAHPICLFSVIPHAICPFYVIAHTICLF